MGWQNDKAPKIIRTKVMAPSAKEKENGPKSSFKWKGINCKQSTRWQHLSWLKASAFFSLQNIFGCYETKLLILGTGTAIWWLTEPH
jgi:hypothetical protein